MKRKWKMSTNSYHSSELSYWLVNIPSIFWECFHVGKRKQAFVVWQWEGIHLQFFKNRTSRVVLLLVCKSQISHIFAKYIDSVGIFTTRTHATDFFHARHNTQRYVHQNHWILLLVIRWLRSKMQAIVGDGERSTDWPIVRTNVCNIVFNVLPLFARQICERIVTNILNQPKWLRCAWLECKCQIITFDWDYLPLSQHPVLSLATMISNRSPTNWNLHVLMLICSPFVLDFVATPQVSRTKMQITQKNKMKTKNYIW